MTHQPARSHLFSFLFPSNRARRSTRTFGCHMQLQEQAIERGLIGPTKRLMWLAVVIYLSACFTPTVGTVLELTMGPKDLGGGATLSRSIDFVEWYVLPPLQALDSRSGIGYLLMLIPCVVWTALDRGDSMRIGTVAGIGTFSFYLIEEFCSDWNPVLQNLLLLSIESAVVLFLYRDFIMARFESSKAQ